MSRVERIVIEKVNRSWWDFPYVAQVYYDGGMWKLNVHTTLRGAKRWANRTRRKIDRNPEALKRTIIVDEAA